MNLPPNLTGPQKHRQYQLKGWAGALAWAELTRDLGLQARAPALVDELGDPTDVPDREPDATVLRPQGSDEGIAAELWIDDDKIIWRRIGEQARSVYDFQAYPWAGLIWPIV